MEFNSKGQSVAISLDDVCRQWGSAVDSRAKESASIKSTAFSQADQDIETTESQDLVAPRRTVETGDSDQGDFVLGQLLGKGGMGLVFRAEQTGLDRAVALKTIIPDHSTDYNARAKFISEAKATGQLDHPNIVPIYELASAPDGVLFYTMKEVHGRSWAKAMSELSEAENIDILLKVADAVAFAHGKGVIHRDLKPENVMLGEYGEVLVMDWGLAVGIHASAKAERLSPQNARGGTPTYMAPEMALADAAKIGLASDVYLLGAILYEILTGLPPHHGENVFACIYSAVQNLIQPAERRDELVEVAKQAMATDPIKRYPDVKSFQQAIRNCREHAASLALSNEARLTLKQAQKSGDYSDYARAVFGFEEALRLWQENTKADIGLRLTRKHYAIVALERGDFDLALSQTKMMPASDSGDLPQKIEAGKAERERRQVRVKRLTQLSVGLGGLVLVIWIIAYWRISQAEGRAVAEAAVAREAERKTAEALLAETTALEQSQKSERKAIESQKIAVVAQQNAEVALAAKERAEVSEKNARAEHTKLSEELAAAAEQLGLWEKTESARVAFLGNVNEQSESVASIDLSAIIANVSAIPVSLRTSALQQKAKTLTSLSLIARQPDDFVALIEAFEKIERQAARSDLEDLRDNVHALTGLLRKRLPQDHDYFSERAITAMVAMTPVVSAELLPDEMIEDAKTREDLHAALKNANPDYNGEGRFTLEDGVVVEVDLTRTFYQRDKLFDLSPLQGLPLRRLNADYMNVSSLAPLRGMPLKELRCSSSQRIHWSEYEYPKNNLNLAPLRGMPLEVLYVTAQGVNSLDPLRGMPLTVLYIDCNPISSFEPLKGMQLEELACGIFASPRGNYDLGSPGAFNLTDRIRFASDLTPLAGMPLKKFTARRHKFKSLDPLQGAPLEYINVEDGELTSIAALHGMPLLYLEIRGNRISSLEPLEGTPLEYLSAGGNKISDLSPLQKLPLKTIYISANSIKSLEPLKDIVTLTSLDIGYNEISDLSPLQKLSLKRFSVSNNPIKSIEPLKNIITLTSLYIGEKTLITSFSSLKDLPQLTSLQVSNNNFSLADIEGLSLETLEFDSSQINTLKSLADMRTLRRLNISSSPVDSFQPLRDLMLTHFGISDSNPRLTDKKDMEILRKKEGLNSFLIGSSGHFGGHHYGTDEFWKKYDASDSFR